MIHLDSTRETIVAVCTRCHYREISTDRGTAWRRALDHVERVHPDDPTALEASRRSDRNHRDRSG